MVECTVSRDTRQLRYDALVVIGLEEVRDGLWNVLYYDTLLGRFDEQSRTITGAPSLKKDC